MITVVLKDTKSVLITLSNKKYISSQLIIYKKNIYTYLYDKIH